jgi:hypothetical protein
MQMAQAFFCFLFLQGGHDQKSTLPDAPWDPFIPQHTQNESLPAYKKFAKTTTTTTTATLRFSMHFLMTVTASSRSHQRIYQT